MKRVYQSRSGAIHGMGDCFSACLASILGEDQPEVPFFYAGARNGETIPDLTLRELQGWLAARGFSYIEFSFPLKMLHIDNQIRGEHFKGPYILTGRTVDGDVHSVVCVNGAVWHDPANPPGGRRSIQIPLTDGTYRLGLLVPLAFPFDHLSGPAAP